MRKKVALDGVYRCACSPRAQMRLDVSAEVWCYDQNMS